MENPTAMLPIVHYFCSNAGSSGFDMTADSADFEPYNQVIKKAAKNLSKFNSII